jgi:hypothetical protein
LEEILETGHLPASLKSVLNSGSSGRATLAAEEATIMAARYVLEVRAGRVVDPAPIKTVREAFGGVTSQTALRWVRKFRVQAETAMQACPLADDIAEGDADAQGASLKVCELRRLLAIEGGRYRRFGRMQQVGPGREL